MFLELGQTLSVSSGEACIPPLMTKLQDFFTLVRGLPNWLARVKVAKEAKKMAIAPNQAEVRRGHEAQAPSPPALAPKLLGAMPKGPIRSPLRPLSCFFLH